MTKASKGSGEGETVEISTCKLSTHHEKNETQHCGRLHQDFHRKVLTKTHF